MRSGRIRCFALSFLFLPLLVPGASAGTITLGTAGSYAVLAGSAVTNTGPSVLNGNVGLYPGASGCPITAGGWTVNGTINACNGAAGLARNGTGPGTPGLTTAFTTAAGLSVPPGNTLTTISGATTLTPGVYSISSTADLTGPLTLKGASGALFIFQSSAFTTASGSGAFSVVFLNTGTGKDGYDPNIFWVTDSSMTLGTYTAFEGNILAKTSITLDTGATITCGSALAENGAVTLDDNTITNCGSSKTTVPEPGTLSLLGSGLAILAGIARRRMRI
jgi:hypothetical protein